MTLISIDQMSDVNLLNSLTISDFSHTNYMQTGILLDFISRAGGLEWQRVASEESVNLFSY